MASRTLAPTGLFITFNVLFFTLVSSTYTPCPPPPTKKTPPTSPPPKKTPTPSPPPKKTPTTPPPPPKKTPTTPPPPKKTPTTPPPPKKTPATPPPPPKVTPTTPPPPPKKTATPCPPPPPPQKTPMTPPLPPTETPTTPLPPPTVTPATPPPQPSKDTCSIDTLKLGVCGNLLNGLIGIIVGTPANSPCCTLIGGLADLDAAVCLCTAIKANVLGINLNVPVSLSLLLNNCGKEAPSGFQCE